MAGTWTFNVNTADSHGLTADLADDTITVSEEVAADWETPFI